MNPSQNAPDSPLIPSSAGDSFSRQGTRGVIDCFQMLYTPRRTLTRVVPKGTWLTPILVVFALALSVSVLDIISILPALGRSAPELRQIHSQQSYSALAGYLALLPLALLAREAVVALILKAAAELFGKPIGYRQTLTIATYSESLLLIQYLMTFIGLRGHLFGGHPWSSILLLPRLIRFLSVAGILQTFGHTLTPFTLSILNYCNVFAGWRLVLFFLGLRSASCLKAPAAAIAALAPWLAETLLVSFWLAV